MDALLDRLLTIGGSSPRKVARTVFFFLFFGYWTGKLTRHVFRYGVYRTLFRIAFFFHEAYIGEKGQQSRSLEIRQKFEDALYPSEVRKTDINERLPLKAMSENEIISLLTQWSSYEAKLWNGTKSMSSGAVYHGGKQLGNLQNKAYALFNVSNALHPEVFPFTRKLESEIIAMTVTLLNGNPRKQCGLLTSGGTESIVMAIRAYKYWARDKKSIYSPELVVPISAHAAFHKACEMFEIKLVLCPINQNTYEVDIKKLESLITSNTIAIVGSAPQYAQGVVDPIQSLSKLAIKYNVGLHVDCCLGSFLLPTLRDMGYDIPFFDFTLPGVTSISCDTHKFGFAVKGSSVLTLKSRELRKYAYFKHLDSTIGLYATQTIQGSRSGAIIAGCWASLMSMGYEGYQKEAKIIMDAVNAIKKSAQNIKEIEIAGNPCMSVIGFVSKQLNILQVSAAMAKRGWICNNCQNPPTLHICVTRCNCVRANKFIQDLKDSVNEVVTYPQRYEKSDAAMYGIVSTLPENTLKDDILETYLDICLDFCTPIK